MKINNINLKTIILVFVCLSIPSLLIIKFSTSKVNASNVNDFKSSRLEGNITFVSNRTDKSRELKQMIDSFEKENPKVKVNLELIGDTEEILRRKASVGELADITIVPQVINASDFSNYFLPIDDLGFNDYNMYNCSTNVEDKGKLYELTTSLGWQGVIYNKQIFNKAGITNLPKDINEFFAACDKIKKIGLTPMALCYKEQWGMGLWLDSIPYLIDKDLERKTIAQSMPILGEESSVYKSLEMLRHIGDMGYCEEDLFDYDWQQCKNDLKDGKVAMFIWNSDFIRQLEDLGAAKDQFGMFPIPDSKYISIGGDCRYAVSKTTKYPEVAKAFLKFMFDDDRYAKAVNIRSSLKNNEENKKLLDELKKFDMPIVMEGDVYKFQSKENINYHNRYYDLRKITELEGRFAQQYVISKDVASLRKEINKKWAFYRDNTREN
ncbi:extracellular solute-binding protein [Clostridium sp. C8-1-8]|uniref:ABC transporter substrate-binding protein n=1 Tax=Clostridium sp. C8-1-8 TaxID=2698831 RepID=UPI00136FEF28|nr:extracellular solute-binding protein [Clostridium sp. C8-1-8]